MPTSEGRVWFWGGPLRFTFSRHADCLGCFVGSRETSRSQLNCGPGEASTRSRKGIRPLLRYESTSWGERRSRTSSWAQTAAVMMRVRRIAVVVARAARLRFLSGLPACVLGQQPAPGAGSQLASVLQLASARAPPMNRRRSPTSPSKNTLQDASRRGSCHRITLRTPA